MPQAGGATKEDIQIGKSKMFFRVSAAGILEELEENADNYETKLLVIEVFKRLNKKRATAPARNALVLMWYYRRMYAQVLRKKRAEEQRVIDEAWQAKRKHDVEMQLRAEKEARAARADAEAKEAAARAEAARKEQEERRKKD